MRRAFLALLLITPLYAEDHPDLTKTPTLYVVGYAHLDTEWRWEYPRTIGEFLPKTLHDNFALFEKYPHYIFNFSGANRYRMMKEYYPDDFAKMKEFVKAGRWFPAGSSMEESDVNSPSAESIIRQILYGNHFFRTELGRTSAEYMLPDCFGFPASLPAILAHSGIKGFSTQKLTWGSAAGIPFNVGVWEGPDGSTVIAAFNPGDYSGDVRYDLSRSDPTYKGRDYVDWPARVQRNGEVSGVFADYHYYGTGDTGGSPRESSVKMVEDIVTKNDGPLHVISSTAEQMFLDIPAEQASRLPRYKGELELTNHSAGSLTSQSYQKRWNRQNELLADAAEKASVAAEWLGTREYPRQRINDAWTLVMGGQFHDIAAGTATPKAYEYSWNDDVLALNQFAAVLSSATEGVASALDTQTAGTPIVVYNPLNVAREDIVEVAFKGGGKPPHSKVFGPDGEVPAQISGGKLLFVAKVPSVGYAVYDVRPGQSMSSKLKISASSLENERYRIAIDRNGDIAGIFDKTIRKELLSAPLRLAFQTEKPHDWPAWNMDWADQQKPPRGYVEGPAKVRIVENGPARVALEISREAEGSKFVQTIRLAAGDAGNRVEIANRIDWMTPAAALKAVLSLTASNPKATYNWEAGTIERGNNDEKKFEVASHQWFDLTDSSGAYGTTVLSDCKYGSDKPDDHTLRLTLIYTPGLGEGNGRAYNDQTSQDWGHHEFVYGLAGHKGDWRKEQTDWQALRLNQPLVAFRTSKHAGVLGKKFSLLRVDNNRIRVMALKKAEDSDEIIVRLVENDGKSVSDVHLSFAAPVISAREVNGQEMPAGDATVQDGKLVVTLAPYQLRAFALKLRGQGGGKPPHFEALELDGLRAEKDVDYAAIRFKIDGANAMTAHGQKIKLPAGKFTRVYVLAAADGDQKATFRLGDQRKDVIVQDRAGYIGQWDNRVFNKKEETLPPRPDAPPGAPPRKRILYEFTGLTPGFIKRAPVAWFAADRQYAYSYLFAYSFDLPPNAKTMTLPDNEKIHIMAVTVSSERGKAWPAQPLYDTLEH
ncbi:MAG TPA: glycoside hydrolase family 38 C-terminal domain-containing protein [Thermoanaerobaculia bacterium]